MKKTFRYLLLTFIVLTVLTIIYKSNNLKDKKLNHLNNIDKNISFFNYKYIDRYIKYKNNNPNLKDIDIITRVNLNLDYPFYENTKLSSKLNKINILVNKYIYLPNDYIPNNLETINTKYALSNKLLVSDARMAFEEMAEDAKKNDYTLRVISAYRSYNYQLELYNKYVATDGIEKADTYSARPGFSEHQTGLVIDIDNAKIEYENFETTEEFKWMQNNAYKYGYILRYPKGKENITGYNYESWHYRYVGKNIAEYLKKNDLTFDEYYIQFIEKEKEN